MADEGWVKQESSGAFHNFEENPELVGIYVEKKENQGEYGSSKYYIKKEDGEIVNFFANALLDDKLRPVPLGNEVKIVYLGKKKGKSGRTFKSFEVFTRPAPDKPDF